MDKFHITVLCLIFVVGFFLGSVWYKGCQVQPCPEIELPSTFVITDSQKAQIYTEGYSDGVKSVKPIVRTRLVSETQFEPDLESRAVANHLYGILDSLVVETNKLRDENSQIKDIVMYDVVDSTRYRLELFARLRERSFRGTKLTIFDPKPSAPTIWDRFGIGPQIGVGVGYSTKFAPTFYLGIGLHYSL